MILRKAFKFKQKKNQSKIFLTTNLEKILNSDRKVVLGFTMKKDPTGTQLVRNLQI